MPNIPGDPTFDGAVTDDDRDVRLELASIHAQYQGKLSANGADISGHWKQGPVDTLLVFRRLAAAPTLSRPQEPKQPYPYKEREISFAGGAGDVTLAGTLTVPNDTGPFPAVVSLTGSGPQNRDEALMGHRPFLVLADHLTRPGIAVLRFDDRGVGKATGSYGKATCQDFAADGRAAFNFLKRQPGIDPTHVGLCAHSEGGVHAPLIAAEQDDVAFIVMLAGVGVPLQDLLKRQRDDTGHPGIDARGRTGKQRQGARNRAQPWRIRRSEGAAPRHFPRGGRKVHDPTARSDGHERRQSPFPALPHRRDSPAGVNAAGAGIVSGVSSS